MDYFCIMKRIIILILLLLPITISAVTTEKNDSIDIMLQSKLYDIDPKISLELNKKLKNANDQMVRETADAAPVHIVINKRQRRLYLITLAGDTIASYPVCASRNTGQKQRSGDCRTPEGTFGVTGIYPSSNWRYKGTGSFCYGPYFIRVRIPGVSGIGIHGTNAPSSVPGRHSHGCIRMHNEDIKKVKSMVNTKSRIIILSDNPKVEERQIAELHETFKDPGSLLLKPDRLAK